MQLLLRGGQTGVIDLTTNGIYVPITRPVLAAGSVSASGLVEVVVGSGVNCRGQLAYRFWATDDSASAMIWNDLDTAVSGPGKVFKSGAIVSVTGVFIQLGLKVFMSSGTEKTRVRLSYPVVVTT